MFTEGQLVNGNYLIQGEAGQGDFGPVYRALDTETGNVCLLSPITLNPEQARSLGQEILRVKSLNHPNISPLAGLQESEQGKYLLADEFLEAQSLEELIRSEAPLALTRACSLARQIAMALEAAHHVGVVHGDLKPSCVAVVRGDDNEEIAKVRGFGTYPLKEKRLVTLANLAVSGEGQTAFGTPGYISPEQALGACAEVLDGRTDLYSLGVILYQLLTGSLPYPRENVGEVQVLLAQIFTEPQPFPAMNIPHVVEALVTRMLAKRREDRPASATAIVDQLAAWEERKTTPAPVDAAAGSVSTSVLETPEAPGERQWPGPIAPASEPENEPQIEPEFDLPILSSFDSSSAPPLEVTMTDSLLSSPQPEAPQASNFIPDIEPAREPEFVSDQSLPSPSSLEFPENNEARLPPASAPNHAAASHNQLREASQGSPGTSGFDAQLEPPTRAADRTVAMAGSPGTPGVPLARAADSRPVMFANFHPRQKSRRRWPKVLGIAAIVVLLIFGGGCGWLYYSGRTYWFNPAYVKMRISSFLNNGGAGSSSPVETDAYSQSKIPAAAANPGRSGTQPAAAPLTLPANPVKAGAHSQSQTLAASTNANQSASRPAAAPQALQANVVHPPTSTMPPAVASVTRANATPGPLQEARKKVSSGVKKSKPLQRSPENPASLVAAAVTRGDYYFDHGDYDAAIRAYEDGLAHSPANAQLIAEIARAKRAKAAEAKYLQ